MQEQVKELIDDMIPTIREEVLKELRPQYEEQFQEQLSQAKNEIQATQFQEQQYEQKKQELIQEIMWQIEQEFDQEKQSLIHNVSISLSKNKSMQVLEQQLRSKIEKEYNGYVDDEIKKKIHLIKLNCQKKYEEERNQLKNQLTDEFTSKLQCHLEKLEENKQQINTDYQIQKDKLAKIEQEARSFNQNKQTQENIYSQQIEEMHNQIQLLQEQISSIKVNQIKQQISAPKLEKELQESQTFDIQSQLSPYQSAFKNQLQNELQTAQFDNLNGILYDDNTQNNKVTKEIQTDIQEPIKTKSDLAYTMNTQQNTHESQIISFNVSQPSIIKNYHQQQQQDKQKDIYIHQQQEQKDSNYVVAIKNQMQEIESRKENNRSLQQQQNAIIEKLENICKQKIRQSYQASLSKQSRITLPQDQFEIIFQVDPKDSHQTKSIKLLRQQLQTKFIEDLQFEEYYFDQITELKLNFIQQFPQDQQNEVSDYIHSLIQIWNKGHLSFQERIQYIRRIINSSNSLQDLKWVYEECEEYYEKNEQLIEKLQQRQSFRSQIIKENFSIQKNKKVFIALKGLTREIKNLLKQKFFWREVDADQIILIDLFEQQLLEKEEMKEEIRKKVEKKFK